MVSDEVAIVTGGTRGIGKAISDMLADEGYITAALDINDRGFEGNNGPEIKGEYRFVNCDVSDEKSVEKAIDRIEDIGNISVLVNNAGIIRRQKGEKIKVEDWDDIFAVNSRGAFLLCKFVAPLLKKRESGSIVNISSIAGKVGDITSAPGYGPSKAAMNNLTKTFARELASYGVTVNAVAPHAIETDMSAEWSDEKRRKVLEDIPLDRLGQPEEVAATVKFLISEGAGFITGEVIDINGGFLMD